MRKPEYSLAPIVLLASLAWCTTSGAQAPSTTDEPPAGTVSGTSDPTATEKAVAARKERCRLHPGTCKRSRQEPEPPKK